MGANVSLKKRKTCVDQTSEILKTKVRIFLPMNYRRIMGKTSNNGWLHIIAFPERERVKKCSLGSCKKQPVNDISSKLDISSSSLCILNGLEVAVDTNLKTVTKFQ